MQHWVQGGVNRNIKQRLENIFQHFLEVLDDARFLVDLVESGDLNHPPDIVALQVILNEPLCELAPLLLALAVDTHPPLACHILLLLLLVYDFLS